MACTNVYILLQDAQLLHGKRFALIGILPITWALRARVYAECFFPIMRKRIGWRSATEWSPVLASAGWQSGLTSRSKVGRPQNYSWHAKSNQLRC